MSVNKNLVFSCISNNNQNVEPKSEGIIYDQKSEEVLTDENFDGNQQVVEVRKSHIEEESVLSCFLESILPLTFAGCGQLTTGVYLDYISSSLFFNRIPAAFALITPLLNLKGNLEMNFASRIATYCHTGNVQSNWDLIRLGIINHGLSQSQTISVSFIIVVICILINFKMSLENVIIFLATALTTASITSFIVETFLLVVIIGVRSSQINPDNVATPMAATIGDISTLILYASFGLGYIYFCPISFCYLSLSVVVILLLLIPVYMKMASLHPITKKALFDGWISLVVAAIVSSGGGFLLQHFYKKFKGYVLIQPLIVGLVGNMCGIQSSRLSSNLHVMHNKQELSLGVYPRGSLANTLNPYTTFFKEGINSNVAVMMILVALPTQLVFAIIVLAIGGYPNSVTTLFCFYYLVCVFILITLFMYLCQVFVHMLWRYRQDPDYNAIPLLTALCDFFGSFLLSIMFYALECCTTHKQETTLK